MMTVLVDAWWNDKASAVSSNVNAGTDLIDGVLYVSSRVFEYQVAAP